MTVTINVPVKACRKCGEVFVIGYNASVGIQFWLTFLTWIGGIIYWGVRGRGERCPTCKSREVDMLEYREINVSDHKATSTDITAGGGADVMTYDEYKKAEEEKEK